ncbi:MAG TPA: Gfo/Idh/MocA family oxidoreductase [Urbifossiella sp.]|jgi:predicted dehydrogenase|nr:Gfo/Idh/MocA family oxidoreductase [Urbifossiella sp.]
MSLPHPDRRGFLAAGSAAALPAASYARIDGANDRVGIGTVGYGLIAKTHVATFTKVGGSAVVAVSDCHRGRVAEGVAAAGGRATGYADFRRLLDDRAVDAVVVATPDHWHALVTMLACAAGKDVYVEKPLTLFVREGEWMQAVAARTRRVVQVGTQQRSGPHYRAARDLIRGGHLGTVTSATIRNVRNVFPGFGSPPDGPPPAEFDWDRFLGPAPLRAYNPNRGLYHFRWFWDTSGGQLTNLCAHNLDIVEWALGLDGLKAVHATGGRFALQDNGETPDTQDVLFDCGRFTTSFMLREAARGESAGFVLQFHGTRGTLGIDRRGYRVTSDPDVSPASQIPGGREGHPVGGPVATPAAGNPRPRTEAREDMTGDAGAQYLAHARNFLECIRSRQTPVSDLASAHRVAVACHLGNIATRLGRSVRWDATGKTIPGDADAAAALTRPYRAPWDRELRALGVG